MYTVQALPLDKSPDKKNHNSRNNNPIYNGLPDTDRKTNAVNNNDAQQIMRFFIVFVS